LVTFILATTGVVVTGVLLAATLNLSKPRRFWLASLVFALCTIHVLVMGLGLIGVLTMELVFLGTAVGLVAAGLLFRRQKETLDQLRDRIQSDLRSAWRTVAGTPTLSITGCIAVLTLAWIALVAIVMPPINIDGLHYHLPPVVEWIQGNRIYAQSWRRVFDPKNVELVYVWNAIFLRDLNLLNATQLGFIPLAVLSVYTITREIGVNPADSALAGLVYLFTPVFLIQAVTAYIDLAVAALILAVFASVIIYWREPSLVHALLVGLTGGLLLGSKYTGIIVAGTAFLCVLATLTRDGREQLWHHWSHVALVGVLFMFLGGYWYVRNLLLFGNPIWPLGSSILGYELFPNDTSVGTAAAAPWRDSIAEGLHGPYEETTILSRIYFSWFEKAQVYGHGNGIGGFGPQWAILGLPSVALFGYTVFRRKHYTSALLLVLFVVPQFFIPRYYVRYNLYLAGLGAIAIGFVRQDVTVPSRILLSVAIVYLLATSAFTASAFHTNIYDDIVDRSLSNPDEITSSSARTKYAPIPQDMYDAHVSEGSTIGFVLHGNDEPYNLYDRHFQNRVTPVESANSSQELIDLVRGQDVDYLVLSRSSEEAGWARNATWSLLVGEYEQNNYQIFEVNR